MLYKIPFYVLSISRRFRFGGGAVAFFCIPVSSFRSRSRALALCIYAHDLCRRCQSSLTDFSDFMQRLTQAVHYALEKSWVQDPVPSTVPIEGDSSDITQYSALDVSLNPCIVLTSSSCR